MFIKLLRATFLIVGTAIGAGVLALPIATVESGFWGAFLALISTWMFMTLAANNLLNARLCFEGDVDLATMSNQMLGKSGKILLDVCYLALLFGLVSLYITVGSAWTRELIIIGFGHNLSIQLSQIIFTVFIASLIYTGIGRLTLVNKFVTIAMLLFLFLIMILSLPKLEVQNIMGISPAHIPSTLPMLLTTFGFSIVIPTLGTYLSNDRKILRQALVAGSAIILITYIAWEFIAFGVIGSHAQGLAALATSQDQGTEVISALSDIVNEPIFNKVGFAFMVTAVLSSIFGVGYCLFSYLKDTLPVKKEPLNSLLALIFGFAIPLVILSVHPLGVSAILGVSGIFVAVILGIFPSLMVLSKYYQQKSIDVMSKEKIIAYLSLAFFIMVIIIELKNLMF